MKFIKHDYHKKQKESYPNLFMRGEHSQHYVKKYVR
jgi:hypothetical protein